MGSAAEGQGDGLDGQEAEVPQDPLPVLAEQEAGESLGVDRAASSP